MAQEGLFFTGTVLKNNRNLLEEEATRQQLEIQKEQLELQKQAAADKRKEARKKNETKPGSYSLDGMDPFYAEQFQGSVSEYQSFVTDNSMDFDDNPELKNRKLKNEGDLSVNVSRYKSISSDLTSYRNLIKNGKGDKLALAEDGSYLFEYNLNKQKEAVGSGDMTIDEAIKAYPTDVDTIMNRTEWVDPTIALFTADDLPANRKVVSNDGEYEYTEIESDKKDQTQTAIKNSLTVNSQGFHNDPNYKRLYDTKLLTIEGNEMTAKEAFFLEAYVDPETEQVGGITGATNLLDILDPESERFNKEASNAYAEYLAKKISEEGYENRGRKQGGKFVGETSAEKKSREAEEAQMEYNVDTAETIASNETADSQGTGYQTHYDTPGLKVTLEKKNIIETITFADIQNGGSDEATNFKNKAKDAQSGAVSAKVKVMGVTLDSNGIPVVLVKLASDDGTPLAGDAYQVFVRYDILADKIPELSGKNVKQLVNYKKPKADFDPNNHSKG